MVPGRGSVAKRTSRLRWSYGQLRVSRGDGRLVEMAGSLYDANDDNVGNHLNAGKRICPARITAGGGYR